MKGVVNPVSIFLQMRDAGTVVLAGGQEMHPPAGNGYTERDLSHLACPIGLF